MADDREDPLEQLVHDHYLRTPEVTTDVRARILRGLDEHDAAMRRTVVWKLKWWLRPTVLHLAPGIVLAVACLLLVAGAWIGGGLLRPRQAPDRGVRATHVPQASPSQIASVPGVWDSGPAGRAHAREVAFMLVAPGVSRVSLVGEFNDWDPLAAPLVRVGRDGPWVTTVLLPPGRHIYGFVLDGSRWMSDPDAPLAPDDGFGVQNSVVVVGQEGRM